MTAKTVKKSGASTKKSKAKSASDAKPKAVRSARGAQARGKLKKAAEKVLERVGYHQMRVSDVTKEAGVAAGLFYHYFSDLKSLTLEVLTDFITRFEEFEEIEKGVSKGDWYGRILSHIEVFVASYADHPGLMRCLLQFSDEVPEFRELYQQSSMKQLKWLAALMPRLFPDSDLTQEEALVVVYSLGSTSEALLREYYITKDSALQASNLSHEEVAELIAVMFYRGLFLENPPSDRLGFGRKLEKVRRADSLRRLQPELVS